MKRCDGHSITVFVSKRGYNVLHTPQSFAELFAPYYSLPCKDIELPVHNVCAVIQLFTAMHACEIPLKTSSESLSLVTPHITAPATSSSPLLLECMQMATPDNTNITPNTALPGLSTFSPNNALVMLENTMAVALHIGTDRVRLDDANVL